MQNHLQSRKATWAALPYSFPPFRGVGQPPGSQSRRFFCWCVSPAIKKNNPDAHLRILFSAKIIKNLINEKYNDKVLKTHKNQQAYQVDLASFEDRCAGVVSTTGIFLPVLGVYLGSGLRLRQRPVSLQSNPNINLQAFRLVLPFHPLMLQIVHVARIRIQRYLVELRLNESRMLGFPVKILLQVRNKKDSISNLKIRINN